MTTERNARLLEMIREIQVADADDAGGTVTSGELARAMGASREKALRTVHDLVEAGKLRPERVSRVNIQGDVQTVAGYRVVDE